MVNLVKVIFEQFLDIVERKAKKTCYEFDECDFNYRVVEAAKHKLLIVIFEHEDQCGRREDVTATVDITNICFEDLTSCDWIAYLEKIATEYVNDICPKKFAIVKETPRPCRERPVCFQPAACRTVTTIIKKRPPPPEEECEVIIEQPCPCLPKCERVPCVPKKEIIIQFENEKLPKCGGNTVLVNNEPKEHEFGSYKGNPDFNSHKWNRCCKKKTGCQDRCGPKPCRSSLLA